jgi:hypothetical protein
MQSERKKEKKRSRSLITLNHISFSLSSYHSLCSHMEDWDQHCTHTKSRLCYINSFVGYNLQLYRYV